MTRSLILLNATDDLPGGEVLRLALQEAVAEVGGLGGLVHLRGLQTSRGLHLAASSGLPAAVTRRWQEIPDDATAAPAVAARLSRPVWLPAPEGPGTGMASVPLPADHGAPFGTLTVVTATAGKPTAGQQDALCAVAGWAAGRLRPCEPTGGRPQILPAGPDVIGEAEF